MIRPVKPRRKPGRSGGYVREDQRHTRRVVLRLDPQASATLDRVAALGATYGLTVSSTVGLALAMAERAGLEVALQTIHVAARRAG